MSADRLAQTVLEFGEKIQHLQAQLAAANARAERAEKALQKIIGLYAARSKPHCFYCEQITVGEMPDDHLAWCPVVIATAALDASANNMEETK